MWDGVARSCQNSQLWTRGGARFFWRRAWRKSRISAPRAGEVVAEVSVGPMLGRLLTWRRGGSAIVADTAGIGRLYLAVL